jgi:hypothetical protein
MAGLTDDPKAGLGSGHDARLLSMSKAGIEPS